VAQDLKWTAEQRAENFQKMATFMTSELGVSPEELAEAPPSPVRLCAFCTRSSTSSATSTATYDDSFAKDGAKIGDRPEDPPAEPVHRDLRRRDDRAGHDRVERHASGGTQKHVGMNFSTRGPDALSLDDFSERIIEPAMSVLAANIESDVLNVYKDVYNQVNNQARRPFAKVLAGSQELVDNLAPPNDRNVCLNTQDNVDLVDA
jgi:hypothetical protein